ncbi:alanyl-tRNA editing protein [Clostridium sp. P21]|uniref:Alanyl-tRNA editing protein n=1 Tax=Clostridium muellerianum TaxID=2716538 RepID=A0A7Y0EKR3_9CLOT|nr:alanine--tRNA ligase-related protein [Clostridium muellerianum]NMM64872.1 alanyl-tRNA editing protein [Clostridium muellerianum]
MTEKLYYKDAYIKECEANVLDIIEKEGNVLVVLDKTPFYPEGGGQPSDIGTIDGIKVNYVSEQGETIYHHMEKAPKNKKVKCLIDFERRFDHMQQHSGEHLISGVIFKLYGGNNKGFHLGEEYVTLDIDIDHFSEDMIKKVEDEVNEYIYANRSFDTYMVTKDEVDKVPARKRINVDEDIRIVEAKDMDCCPCCGTHVKTTSEVGIVKILKAERYKGMTRIYIKCGKRALKDFQLKHDIVTNLNKALSVDENGILDRVNKQFEEIEGLKRESSRLKSILAGIEAENIIKNAKSKLISILIEDKSFEDIQLIGSIIENNGYIVILASLEEQKILFLNNTDIDVSCGKLFKEHIKEFNGKGGGKDKRAQGTFDNKEDLTKFCQFLSMTVREKL